MRYPLEDAGVYGQRSKSVEEYRLRWQPKIGKLYKLAQPAALLPVKLKDLPGGLIKTAVYDEYRAELGSHRDGVGMFLGMYPSMHNEAEQMGDFSSFLIFVPVFLRGEDMVAVSSTESPYGAAGRRHDGVSDLNFWEGIPIVYKFGEHSILNRIAVGPSEAAWDELLEEIQFP